MTANNSDAQLLNNCNSRLLCGLRRTYPLSCGYNHDSTSIKRHLTANPLSFDVES